MEDSSAMIKRYVTYDTLPVVNIKSIETSIIRDNYYDDDLDKKEGWKTRVVNFKRELLNPSAPNGNIVYGRTVKDVPNKKIKEISPSYVSALCSPSDCIKRVHKKIQYKIHRKEDVAQMHSVPGILRWDERKDFAYGMAVSLYENDSESGHFIGDPVADSLAVVTRKNCGILALADGVSWGQKSKLASNCSIYGSITYICEHIEKCVCTKDVFRCILRSFENAQKCIVEEEATMTTLCVGIVVQLQEKDRFGFCVVNVGDSYAYIYSKKYGVKEVTYGSHPIDEVRDMRYSGGALGPADGYNPDLENLTCSFVVLEKGDVVFLCSDGVSDNFDPVVAKFAPRFKTDEKNKTDSTILDSVDSKYDDAEYQVDDNLECHHSPIIDIPNINLSKLEQEKLFSEKTDQVKLLKFEACGSAPSHKGSPTSSDDCHSHSLSNSPNGVNQSNLSSMDKKILKSCDCLTIKKIFDKYAKLESDVSSNEEDNADDIDAKKNEKIEQTVDYLSDKCDLIESDLQIHIVPQNSEVTHSCDLKTSNVDITGQSDISKDVTDQSNALLSQEPSLSAQRCGSFGEEHVGNKRNSVLEFAYKQTNSNTMIRTSQSDHNINSTLNGLVENNKQINSIDTGMHCNSMNDILRDDQENNLVLKCKSHSDILKHSTVHKDFKRTVSEQEHLRHKCKKRMSLCDGAIQMLTPRERHKGALEQMTEIIKSVEFEPINGTCVRAVDVCAQLMNFVVNRTAEKRDVLEETPQSQLNRLTSKERKQHNEKIKKILESVPGKLDHASIVAYEVDVHGKEFLTLHQQKSTDSYEDISAEKKLLSDNDAIAETSIGREIEPVNYNQKETFRNCADRKKLYAYK